jgi:hypothetical protein
MISSLLKTLDITTDPGFEKLLLDTKHQPARPAPSPLQEALCAVFPFRLELSAGISFISGILDFSWFIPEFGVKKGAVETKQILLHTMEDHGFVHGTPYIGKEGFEEVVCTRKQGNWTHTFCIKRLMRFHGTKTPSSGGTLLYNITGKVPDFTPVLEDILSGYPALCCPELPKEFLDLFSQECIRSLFYGGTWSRRYTWNVKISSGTEEESAALCQKTAGLIESQGSAFDHSSRGVSVYMRKGGGGPVYSIGTCGGGIFSFRIQPFTR